MEESFESEASQLRQARCKVLAEARQAKAEAEALIRDTTAKLIDAAGEEERWDLPEGSASIVRPVSVKVRADELRVQVGEEVWNQITTPALDDGLLSEAITKGLVSIETVSDCSTVTDRTPYVRLSR